MLEGRIRLLLKVVGPPDRVDVAGDDAGQVPVAGEVGGDGGKPVAQGDDHALPGGGAEDERLHRRAGLQHDRAGRQRRVELSVPEAGPVGRVAGDEVGRLTSIIAVGSWSAPVLPVPTEVSRGL